MHSTDEESKTAADSKLALDRLTDWRVYAAAIGATLAMTANADAAIVYSTFAGQKDADAEGIISLDLPFAPNLSFARGSFRLANALPVDAFIYQDASGQRHVGQADFEPPIGPLNYGEHPGYPYFLTQKFEAGQLIAGRANPLYPTDFGFWTVTSKGQTFGQFGPGTVTGFVGFELPLSNSTGWIRVRISDEGSPGFASELQLIDYAYNNAGGPILAGQTTDSVPEPRTSAVGLLATGAVGLLAWRKRRTESSPQEPLLPARNGCAQAA